jgi:single-strand DNA-binding protein
MGYFNKVILIGNLTRDPELRYTPKGTAIAKLGLAINRTWRDEAGATHEEATFVDVEAFSKPAETIAQYLKKGSPILVEGRLRQDTWDDKQTNQKRSRLLVVLESFRFMDSGRNREAGMAEAPKNPQPQPQAQPQPAPTPTPPPPPAPDMEARPPEEDDIPF